MNTLANLARVTTATTGTGTITLGAAVATFLTFAQAGVADGAVVTYSIEDVNGGREVGTGTYTLSGTTLSRDTVHRSTGAGNTAKISLSGNAEVFITASAEDLAAIPLVSITGFGTGVATALALNVGSAGAPVTFNGALGTPLSGTATNLTGLPVSTGISGLAAGIATFLGTPSSANLATAVTGETGSGALVFGTSPTISTLTLTGDTTIPGGGQITSAGVLLLKSSTAILMGGVSSVGLQTVVTTGSPFASWTHFSNNANTNFMFFGKSRGTTALAGAVVSGDPIWSWRAYGDDGSTNGAITIKAADHLCSVDGTVSTGVVPARFTWGTTNAAGVFAERLRLHSSGGLALGSTTDPGVNNFLAGGLIMLAGATSSFPALKRSAARMQHRLADDSAFGGIDASDVGLQGATSGTTTLKAAAVAGTTTITLPAGTTDFSATGPGVLQQTSAGAAFTVGAVPVTQGGARLALISTLTANNTATSLEWTGLTGDDYLLVVRALMPATNGANINLQMGTGAGPTWITASTYKWFAEYWVESTNAVGNQSNTADPGIQLGNAVDNTNGGLLGCSIKLFGLSLSIRHMAIYDGYRLNGGVPARIGGRGTAAGSTAKTAVRIITSTGNLSSGSASLYRIVP